MMNEDISLLDCFAIFAAVSLERSELKDIAKLGSTEYELKEWVADNERDLFDQIPSKLTLSIEDKAKLWTVNLDAQAWASVQFFKAIFAIFDRLNFSVSSVRSETHTIKFHIITGSTHAMSLNSSHTN